MVHVHHKGVPRVSTGHMVQPILGGIWVAAAMDSQKPELLCAAQAEESVSGNWGGQATAAAAAAQHG